MQPIIRNHFFPLTLDAQLCLLRKAMLHGALFLVSFLCISCSSQRHIVSQSTTSTDSLSSVHTAHTLTQLDSLLQSISLSFDTLQIDILRPTAQTCTTLDSPKGTRLSTVCPVAPDRSSTASQEVIRLRAVNGQLHSTQSSHSQSVATLTQSDTTSRHTQSSTASDTQTQSTVLYTPPSGNLIFSIAIIGGLLLLAALLFYLLRRYLP